MLRRPESLRAMAAALWILASVGAAYGQGGPAFTVSSPKAFEGDSGTTDMTFTVGLVIIPGGDGPCQPLDYSYTTADETANGGVDYLMTTGVGVLDPVCGPSSFDVTVPVVGDFNIEPNEAFLLEVTDEFGAQQNGTALILNDDFPPSISVSDTAVLEGDAGTVDAVFTIALAQASRTEGCGPVFFDFMTLPGTAEADVDYQTTTGSGMIDSCNPVNVDVPVPVIGDLVDEGTSQNFFLEVIEKQKPPITGTGTITDDDDAMLSIGDAGLMEGDDGTSEATLTVSLTNPLEDDLLVDYETEDGTATESEDYVGDSGIVTIRAGAVDAAITTLVNGDTFFEGDETFFANISVDFYGPPITDDQGTVTILNDDPEEGLSIDDVAVTEGDSGPTLATFTVSLSSPLQVDLEFAFATSDGSATAGSDYVAVSGTGMIPKGGTSTTLDVTVNGDTLVEDDETFFVDIDLPVQPGVAGGASEVVVAVPRGTATITNDDEFVGVLSIDDISVSEGDSLLSDAIFTVTLSVPAIETVFVDFATSNGTGKAGQDYRATSGRVAIGVSETSVPITIPVDGDTAVEGDESFFVNLTGSSGPLIERERGVATIVNDDFAPEDSVFRLASVPTVAESAGSAEIVVERNGDVSGAASVTLRVVSGSATAGTDFAAVDTVVSFASGESGTKSIEVDIVDDAAVEGDETATVTLSDPVGATLGTPSSGELTITDDDMAVEVEMVGEAETVSTVDQEAELVVRVLDGAGNPVEGAPVDWVAEGAAQLVGEVRDTTDSEGISQRTVELDGVPGLATVTATLAATGQQIVFNLTVEGDLRELFPESAADSGEASVASALDTACVGATGQFGSFCGYLFTLPGTDDQRAVLGEITPEETPAQGTMSLQSAQDQLRNVGSRLAALRGEGTRQSISQLALDINGRPVPWKAIVAAMAPVKEFELPDFAGELLEQEDEEVGGGTDVADVDAAPRLGFFVNGRVSMGERDGTSAEEGFDVDANGMTLGLDYRVTDRFVFGGALGYLDTDLELVNDGGGLDAQGISLAAYATYFRPAIYFDWVVAYGTNDYEIARNVDLPIPFEGQSRWTARGNPDSTQLSLAMSAGYDRPVGATTFGLFAKGSYVDADVDAYRETGAGPFNLSIAQQSISSLLGEAGVEVLRSVSRDWGVMQPTLRIAYLHEFDDDSRLIRGSFLGDPGATEFVLATDAPDRDFFNLGAGLTFVFTKGRSCYISYDTDLERSDLEIFTLSAGFRWEF